MEDTRPCLHHLNTHRGQLGCPGVQEAEERCTRSLSSCIWSRIGRLRPQAMLRSPSMIRAPSSCGKPTHVSLFPQSSPPQGSLLTISEPPEGPGPPPWAPLNLLATNTALLLGIPSSSGGRHTSLYVLQGVRLWADQRKPEACPSTALFTSGQGHGLGRSS